MLCQILNYRSIDESITQCDAVLVHYVLPIRLPLIRSDDPLLSKWIRLKVVLNVGQLLKRSLLNDRLIVDVDQTGRRLQVSNVRLDRGTVCVLKDYV